MPTAVITGAGRGLGAVLADRLAAAGYDVVRTDITGAEVALDVSDADACRDLASGVRPDIWINNAGVLGAGDAATQPDAVIQRVISTNLLGTINGTRAAVAVMRQRCDGTGDGHVINIGSLASWVPVPGECVYAATKAGMLSFTLGLRAELDVAGVTGVHLSVVCPDGMLTPMIVEELHNPAIALSFSGTRVVEPDEIADRVLALLERPRLVASVPRWRGAMVRAMASVPDLALAMSETFHRIGTRNRLKTLRGADGPRAAQRTAADGAP